ncbi:MAG: hypothetical protein P9L92_04885 [Candidatus Electryonea clarkiae]|nr:hypothetical protein [Candidatus Electryonea clarkiae]MDP8288108.1 hypothetical protein [Candidatus Electryonea clarkiae]
MSLFWEDLGLPRIAGRIFGWLLVCNPSHLSASELAELTGASKGSISSMTRLLSQARLIERAVIPGERRVYWQMRDGGMSEIVQQRMLVINNFIEIANEGLYIFRDEPE